MLLIERDLELGQLLDMFDRCVQGVGGIAVVRGTVGAGKTALLQALTEQVVNSRTRLLSATGSLAEHHIEGGVLGQLLLDVGGDHDLVDSMISQPGHHAGQAESHFVAMLWQRIVGMASQGPVLIVVDDIHHADEASLRGLEFIARRVRKASILVVVTEHVASLSGHLPIRSELLRQPNSRQIRLPLLTDDGVAALLAQELDPHVAHSWATEIYSISGGNPLMAQALAEDWRCWSRSADVGPSHEPAIGQAFSEVVNMSLHRFTPQVRCVAQAIAVVGGAPGADQIAEIAGTTAGLAQSSIELLNDSGILVQGRFRHPTAARAAVQGLAAGEVASMHLRAARLIHGEGGRSVDVARHLVAAGGGDEHWACEVLQRSARVSVAGGQIDFALDCFRLAQQIAGTQTERAVVSSALARTEWMVDPANVLRHLGHLATSIEKGQLTGHDAMATTEYLLWHGRFDDAAKSLERMVESTSGPDDDSWAGLRDLRACLEQSYPAVRLDHAFAAADPRASARQPAIEPSMGTSTLVAALTGLAGVPTVAGSIAAFQCLRLDEVPLAAMATALLALGTPERLDSTAPWCVALIDEAAGRGMPIWRGLLAAVRADSALLSGDLPAAISLAESALREFSRPGWGVVVGAPLACLVTAATEMGRYEDVAAYLQDSSPESLLHNPFGLRYLRARGQYQLAVNKPYAALTDFQACGAMLAAWQADTEESMPWRIDAAQALLTLDRVAEARKLLDEQIRRLQRRTGRTYGRALRHLAATAELRGRPSLLAEAARVLQASGDRLELAHTLVDLSESLNALGDSSRARLAMRRAWRVAKECEANGLSRRLLPSLAGVTKTLSVSSLPDSRRTGDLSEAERRVAMLAAEGHTNRQIARKLFITVSTVEQHLTRIYRKLNVRSRIDLPVGLEDDPADVDPGVRLAAAIPV